jgi:hypothetical protein
MKTQEASGPIAAQELPAAELTAVLRYAVSIGRLPGDRTAFYLVVRDPATGRVLPVQAVEIEISAAEEAALRESQPLQPEPAEPRLLASASAGQGDGEPVRASACTQPAL